MPTIPGPRGPIAYTRDEWGYPSIKARDRLDAAFAHGWMIGTDRLIQVHLMRVAAEGRLMACLGDKPLFRTLDRLTRMFTFPSDAAQEVARTRPDTRALLEAWCAGFNAVATSRSRGLVLRVVGEPMRPMTPADVLVLYRMGCFFGLTSLQLSGELGITALMAGGAAPDLARLLLGDSAGGVDPELAASADLSMMGWFMVPAFGGSNAAVVSADRSASGQALLWAQPHMEIGRLPPVLYAMHFELEDGSTLTGMNLPGVPWLSFGRTERIAWSYTYGHGDNIDILIEHCKDGRYLADGQWRELVRRDEVVEIKGGTTETWTFWDSPYGTVLGDAATEGRYPCVRWTGLRREGSDLDFVLPLEAAQTTAEALELHRELKAISLHTLVADADGTVGYTQTGQVDQRPEGWDGAGPAVGWTRADRDPAPLPESTRPLVIPEDGLWVSANERVDGPDGTRWVTMPEPRWRKERILEQLGPVEQIDASHLRAAMYDSHDRCAEVLLATWQPLFDDPDFQALCAWGGAGEHPERGAMLCRFHCLHDELVAALLVPRVGAAAAEEFVDELMLPLIFQWHLDQTLALLEPELLTSAQLAELLPNAWAASATRAEARKADLPVTTRFNNAYFEGKLPAFLGFDSPELVLPGGPVSPFQARRTAFQGGSFVFGPAMNFFVDFSKPGASYNMAGGASERRLGPGYGKGLEAWLKGELRPLGRPDDEV